MDYVVTMTVPTDGRFNLIKIKVRYFTTTRQCSTQMSCKRDTKDNLDGLIWYKINFSFLRFFVLKNTSDTRAWVVLLFHRSLYLYLYVYYHPKKTVI